jgi:predicted ribosomally synthesized peptide with nif11-like leader
MSRQSLDAFRKRLAEDEALRRDVARTFGGSDGKAVASADQLVAFASARGYAFSPNEVRESVELSDSELESVAGGAATLEIGALKAGASEVLYKIELDLLSGSWSPTVR